MKTSKLKTLACIAAFIITPAVAMAGGTNSDVQDKATTGHTNDPDTGTRAGEMRTDGPDSAVKGDGKVDDAVLADNVENALKADAQTSELDIKVKVRSGAVTLSGDAADIRWKSRAEAVAASVKGVKSVKNNIKIGS